MKKDLLPETGTFTVKEWASILGCQQATVRRYVLKFNIPLAGSKIDAAEFWRSLLRKKSRRR